MGKAGELVKSILPPQQWRKIRRATNRLRWLLKLKLLKQYGFPIAQRPVRALRYILWDPEVESFSYHMENEPELATFLSNLLKVDRARIIGWIDEAKTDPVLARDRGFRWSSKRFQPLGNRLMWYPIVRAIKPKLIVEAGVHEGLGSETLLRALERNGEEGSPGKLLSFDIHDDTGWLVAPHLKENWEFVLESTLTGMEPAINGREVDMFVHETPHTPEFLETEFDIVLRHAAERLIVIDSSGVLRPTLRDVCDANGATHHYFLDLPKNHIVKSYGTGFAVFDRSRIKPSSPRHPARTPAATVPASVS